jgi:hypothetical protein
VGVLVIYKPMSEHSSSVESFLHDFERRTSRTLETLDPESRRGAELCRAYDIVEYPSVLALADNGEIRNLWRGLPMPLIDEVSYYAL